MTDSKIAQEYQCGRPKTAAVLKHLATDVKRSIKSAMKTGPYWISADDSKDQRDKQFPHPYKPTIAPHDCTNPLLIHMTIYKPTTDPHDYEHFHSFKSVH